MNKSHMILYWAGWHEWQWKMVKGYRIGLEEGLEFLYEMDCMNSHHLLLYQFDKVVAILLMLYSFFMLTCGVLCRTHCIVLYCIVLQIWLYMMVTHCRTSRCKDWSWHIHRIVIV